jgi:hypothetical protein
VLSHCCILGSCVGDPGEDGAPTEDGGPGDPGDPGAPTEDGDPGDPGEDGDAILS